MADPAFWTPEQDAQLIKFFEAGLSAKEIGKKFGRSRNSVLGRADRLRRQGQKVVANCKYVPRRQAPRKPVFWTPEKDAQLIGIIRNGAGNRTAAKILGRTHAAVRKRVSILRDLAKLPPCAPRHSNTEQANVMRSERAAFRRQHAAEPVPLMVSLMENRGCKWPIGDPLQPDFGFCGHSRMEGKPYCPHHLTRSVYIPATNRASSPPVFNSGVKAWRTENPGSRNAT